MARTVMQVLDEAAREHASLTAYKVFRRGVWQSTSWAAYHEQVRQVARGFIALGVEPGKGLAIIGANRPEWLLSDIGAIYAGGFPAGIYTTSAPEQCAYITDHCEASVAVVENHEQLSKFRDVRDRMPRLQTIVLMEGRAPAASDPVGEVITWNELLQRGSTVPESTLDERVAAQRPEDCCTLIYTSGTTGPPKAVMISHQNYTWVVETLLAEIDNPPLKAGDQLVSYLPLSHVAEQVVSVHAPMGIGGCVWFVPELEKLGETLQLARPALFFAVPRVWEKIQAKIVAAAAENPSPVKKAISSWARKVGLQGGYAAQRGEAKPLLWPLAERLVFSTVRKKLGLDRCVMPVTSAAPIALSTLEFFLSLGITICEVYGMSEVTGPSTLSVPWRVRTGKAGYAFPGSELKVAEDGEILMRGPHVFLGYFKNEEATRETIDADGWLHSGDVGTLDEDGFLKITDRKKELFVTAGGKNIAPQVVEGLLKSIPLVMQAVALGDGRKFMAALLVLDPERIPAEAEAAGVTLPADEPVDPVKLCENGAFREHVQRQLDEVNSKLSRVEAIKRWAVLPGELTPEGGELTPTLKLKRRVIYDKYGDVINGIYDVK